MERKCENCDFWQRERGQGYGMCRRYGPGVRPEVYYAYWPITQARDWCGEYRQRQQTEK